MRVVRWQEATNEGVSSPRGLKVSCEAGLSARLEAYLDDRPKTAFYAPGRRGPIATIRGWRTLRTRPRYDQHRGFLGP